MAEVAVAGALVLVEIVSVSLDHLNLKVDVKNKIGSMKSWLTSMKAFIEDNQCSESGSRMREKDQVDKVRDAAYEIEDVLEEFLLHSQRYEFHNRTITKKVHRAAHHVYHGFPYREIYKKIDIIKARLDDIKLQNETFFSNPRASSSSTANIRQYPTTSPLLLDDEMIGYESQKKDFITQLLGSEENLLNLAVVGPHGSGKTTFVKNVFWKRRTYAKFNCHAWVCVSRHCDANKLFINMLKQFCSSRKEPYRYDDNSNPLMNLQNYLARKRYIIVLDDVWRKEDWVEIKKAFDPHADRRSRVIVTTNSSDVATICASSRNHTYSLNCLEWSEGWRLFCRKAFSESNGECPSELKDCSVRIVKRCEGLPLALVALGGVLSHKPKLPNEWERFHDSIGSEIRNSSIINNALLPRYMDLSSNLKSCFLYFSIFPEDYSVERGRLIRLWVAERFVQTTDGETVEEVAEGYLMELIRRNLVHVSKWDFDGRPRNCRVLNLVLHFIIQKCRDENFAAIFNIESNNMSQSLKIRRLSVHNDYNYLPERGYNYDGVRSMFLLRLLDDKPLPNYFENNLREVKLLRILDLQSAPLTEFPKHITRLSRLRYLCFRNTKITTIPHSIKKLFYLETLDLKQTNVRELPEEICHLHNLCHLFAYKYNVDNYVVFNSVRGVKVSGDISNLKNLQDFSLVEVDEKGRILKDLTKLRKLRKLGLKGLKVKHANDLCAAIEQNRKLRNLDLWSANKEEYLELGYMMRNPPRMLERLYLSGPLKQLPSWINSSLSNLLRVGLKWSKMEHTPLGALARLPNLLELQLVDCYTGGELIFEASCFKKLKILLIEDFCQLHTVVIRDGAMTGLEQISIRKCLEMKILPLGIENLGEVQKLSLYDMAEDLITKIRKNGEDREMVNRIPIIHSFTLENQSWQFENLSDSSFMNQH